jgi:glutamate/tyrosine decarboxylase-like PLP-dependent enzyme
MGEFELAGIVFHTSSIWSEVALILGEVIHDADAKAEPFGAAIQQDLDHAQRLAATIKNASALELAGPVELSAVCFRHRVKEEASEEMRNLFKLALLKLIVSRGKIYLSNTELKGRDIDAVVPEVLDAASEIMLAYQCK